MVHGFVHLLNYWHRLAPLPDFTLAKIAYNLQMDRNGIQSEWAATFKYLLSLLGINNPLSNPLLVSCNTFSKMCTAKLRKVLISQWHSQINMGSQGLLGFR